MNGWDTNSPLSHWHQWDGQAAKNPWWETPRIGGSWPGKSIKNSSSKGLRERIRHLTTEATGEFFYCHAFWPALPTFLCPFLPPKINLSHQGNGTFWVFHGTTGTSPYPSSSGMIPDTGHRWLCQQTWYMYWCLLISSLEYCTLVNYLHLRSNKNLMPYGVLHQPRFFGQNSGKKHHSTFKAPKSWLLQAFPHFEKRRHPPASWWNPEDLR